MISAVARSSRSRWAAGLCFPPESPHLLAARLLSSLPFEAHDPAATQASIAALHHTSSSLLLPSPIDPPTSVGPILEAGMSAVDAFHSTVGILPWWASLAAISMTVRTVMLPVSLKGMRASAALFPLLRQARSEVARENTFKYQSIKNEKDNGDDFSSQTLETPSRENWPEILRRYRALREARGALHPSWIIGAPLLQLPVFITAMASVRTMAVHKWEGFDQGGLAWFHDLTLPALDVATLTAPMGSIGVTLPAVIVLSMFANIDAAFSAPARSHAPPAVHSNSAATIWALGKVRLFLEWTLVPLFAIALQLPQGALCYWAGSSAFALVQNRLLKFPAVRAAAGLHTAAGTPPTQATPTTLGTTELNAQHSSTSPTASATATPQNRVASEDIAALFLRAAELQAKGAGSEAAAVLERVLAAHPGHPRALFALGQVRSGLKDWEGAGHSYLQAAKNEDEEPAQRCRAWFGAGVALHMVQREEDALAAFRNAAAPEAEERLRVRAWVSAAALHEKLGSVGEAIKLLRKAAEVEPKVDEVYLQPLLKKNA